MKLLIVAALAVACSGDKLAPNHQAPSYASSSGGADFLSAPNQYLPPQNNYLPPDNSYLPPSRPQIDYQPKPQVSYLPPQNNYLPPEKPQNAYLPPQTSYRPPQNTYRPPQNTYRPPQNTYRPPQNTYRPPQNAYLPPRPVTQRPPQNSYLPPVTQRPPQNSYLPPVTQRPPRPQNSYLPPDSNNGYPTSHGGGFDDFNQINTKPIVPILDQENTINSDGSYRYSYTSADQTHVEQEGHLEDVGTPDEGQSVTGSYEYLGPDGIMYKVSYIADKYGYRAFGDHLPTPPPIPKAIQLSLVQNAAAEAERASNGYSSGYPSSNPSNQYLPPKNGYNDGYY